MTDLTVGFAMCGSFCTFSKVIPQIENLVKAGAKVQPIMSVTSATTDTRFGKADDFINEIEKITSNKIIKSIYEAEPIGPKKLLDILVIEPCTGNTLAKLANGISDTPVTLAAKAHLRNNRPIVIAVSTNDALGTAAKNIGQLMNFKNIYFVPMSQDNYKKKPNSVVADFTKTLEAVECALKGEQLQPLLLAPEKA
ncbi:MAG: dipicolinate synthase subunit B [Clostridiales bacterium]|nr:dipicolinate synthase subunit B [Clostridiales bacterium]